MKKNTASRNHDDFVVEQLKKNPRFFSAYLNEALSDKNEDPRVVIGMLRKLLEARGEVRREVE